MIDTQVVTIRVHATLDRAIGLAALLGLEAESVAEGSLAFDIFPESADGVEAVVGYATVLPPMTVKAADVLAIIGGRA